MANWLGGLAGAGTGFATGGPVGGVLGGLAGLFGGGPSISPEQRRLLQMQTQAAQGFQDYSKGVPLSDPMEQAALASQRGLLGQQQRGMMSNLFSSLGAGGSPAPTNMMGNLATQFQGQQSALVGQAFQNSLQARRNALLQSAQIAQGALPAAQPNQPGFNLREILGQLAQQFAYRDALRRKQQQQMGTQLQLATPTTPGIVNMGGNAPSPIGFNFGSGMGFPTFNAGQLALPNRYP